MSGKSLFGSAFISGLALGLFGCAPSGDDALNRLSEYRPPTGEFVLRYLEPPWQLDRADGTTVRLWIPSNANLVGVDGGPPKYELMVTVEPGRAGVRVEAEQRAANARGESTVVAPRAVSALNAEGRELLTTNDLGLLGTREYRYVYFDIGPARVLRMAFDASPDLDSAEVTEMIGALEISPL